MKVNSFDRCRPSSESQVKEPARRRAERGAQPSTGLEHRAEAGAAPAAWLKRSDAHRRAGVGFFTPAPGSRLTVRLPSRQRGRRDRVVSASRQRRKPSRTAQAAP